MGNGGLGVLIIFPGGSAIRDTVLTALHLARDLGADRVKIGGQASFIVVIGRKSI